ncbi:efflux RND transporter periplasmic adaptor subunit [Marivita hallyeonensis]|uniref:RND family efflux transporter, MFP subunit n=1 Tax=Marivita hallyeonensis TaxID=996342 RepID=A0A1M5LTD6_9RHOB|nr:efflux RND transporter periplasmic adaptor subunit [Marivita hallyeonensis]SHG68256.1 RND family efflux transporter, MFP subunit [Marivita hallyeonensis]
MSAKTLLLMVTVLALAACLPEEENEATEDQTPVRTVRTEVAVMADPVITRSFPAVLEPPQITPLAFDIGGRLGPVRLQIGQAVAQGDVLATVEAADADLRLRQTEAALSEAEVTLANALEEADRQNQLFQRNVASEAARDRAQTTADQARARVEQQRRSLDLVRETLSDTELRAPFDGFINSVEVQNFGSVAAGQPVVTLYQDEGLQATILVSYEIASNLELGQPVDVRPDNGNPTPLPATVTEIARRAPAVSSFPVVVTLTEPRPDLRSGMAVEVLINSALPETLRGVSLPLGALATQRPADLSTPGARRASVFVVASDQDGGHVVQPRDVTLSAVVEGRLVVRDGLQEGERVVTAGVPFLEPGQAVRLEPGATSERQTDMEVSQ